MPFAWFALAVALVTGPPPAAGGVVSGRVLDADGRPVARATVEALARTSDEDDARRRFAGQPRAAMTSVTTGEDGAFRIDLPARAAWVQARHEGFLAALEDVEETAPVTLTLRRPPLARGLVTAAGLAVPGASVVWMAEGVELFSTTGADGSFALPDPAEVPGHVVVLHRDFAPRAAAFNGRGPVEVKLDAGVALEGVVVDGAGRPAPGASILVEGAWPLAQADAQGRFRVAHAPREWSRLLARDAGRVGLAGRRTGRVSITVHPARTLAGTVTDARTRRPLAGATVVVSTPAGTVGADSDARGAFQVTGLPAGTYHPYAARAGYRSGPDGYQSGAGIDLRTRAQARFDVALEPLTYVRGRVQDENGRPVEGALVGLGIKDTPNLYVRDGPASDEGPQASSVVSGADGTFALPEPPEPESEDGFDAMLKDRPVAVLKEGFAAAQAPVTRDTPVVVTLRRGVELQGRVVGPDGAPLAGVEVGAAEDGAVAGGLMPTSVVVTMSQRGWTKTDAAGRFSLRVHPQPHHVGFHARGYAVKVVKGHDVQAPLEVALEPGASVRGRVSRADGTGVAGVAVFASASGMMTRSGSTATTADDGAFELGDLQPGVYTLRFHHADLGLQQTRTVEAPASGVDLVLGPAVTLRGRVLEEKTRRPVTRFTVWTTADGGESWRTVHVEDADGAFAIGDVPAGEVKVRVGGEGYVAKDAGPLTLEAGIEPDAVEVLLETDAPVAGRVTDGAGLPVEGARVAQLEGGGATTGAQARTDANGDFELRGLEAGDLTLSVAAKGFVTQQRKVEGGERTGVEVVLQRGLSLRGEVVKAGAGVPGAWVAATLEGRDPEPQSSQTDARGRFTIEGLVPGRYTVAAYAEQGRAKKEGVDPTSAGAVQLSLDKAASAVLVGRVVGLPDGEVMVMVSAVNEEGDSGQAVMGGDRRFEMKEAPAGRVTVTAMAVSLAEAAAGDGGMRSSRPLQLDLAPGSSAEATLEFSDVTVSGTVVRDGAALPLVNVMFRSDEGASGTGRTDASGAYRIEGLADGPYTVHVSGDRLSFTTEYVVAGSGTFDIDVTGGTLRGRLTEAGTGTAVPGVQVSLFRLGEKENTPEASATSGAAGTFEQRDLREGRYRLITSKVGYGQEVREVEVARGVASDVDVELRAAAGLRLKVVDARDRRPLDAYVVVRDADKRIVANRHGGVGDDGSLTIPLADGSYTLSTSASGFGTATLPVRSPAGGLEVALTPGGTLVLESASRRHGRVRLVRPDGEEYVRCWCNGIADIELKGRRTTVENVTPGTYSVELEGGDGTRQPVVVQEGQTSTVTLP